MKKKFIFAIALLAITSTAVFALSSFSSKSSNTDETTVQTDATCQGKNCTYTVGCDCPGFSPITDKEEYKKDYCKHCGHPKSSHR